MMKHKDTKPPRHTAITTALMRCVLVALCLCISFPFVSTSPSAPQTSAADIQLATIKQYCAGCHNDRAKTGGVSFDGITAASIAEHPDLFEKAVRKLRGRVMPPPGSKQPEPAAVDSLVTWLETSLDAVAGQAHIPDQVVL